MDLSFDRREGCVLVRIAGRLDRWTAGQLEQGLATELVPPLPAVALDCTRLEYVSSAGLRVVLGVVKQLRPASRSVVLFGLQPMVREVFEISGFTDFLPVVLDEAAAVAAAAQAPRPS